MYAVLDDLPAGLRADLEGLEAVHDMGAFRTGAYRSGGTAGLEKAMTDAGTAVHPMIAHHPITGRPYLNVSESFTRWIIGMSAPESARLLTILFEFINRPQFHMRLRWRPAHSQSGITMEPSTTPSPTIFPTDEYRPKPEVPPSPSLRGPWSRSQRRVATSDLTCS